MLPRSRLAIQPFPRKQRGRLKPRRGDLSIETATPNVLGFCFPAARVAAWLFSGAFVARRRKTKKEDAFIATCSINRSTHRLVQKVSVPNFWSLTLPLTSDFSRDATSITGRSAAARTGAANSASSVKDTLLFTNLVPGFSPPALHSLLVKTKTHFPPPPPIRQQRLVEQSKARCELSLDLPRQTSGIDCFQAAHKLAATLISQTVAEIGADTFAKPAPPTRSTSSPCSTPSPGSPPPGIRCEQHLATEAGRRIENLPPSQRGIRPETSEKSRRNSACSSVPSSSEFR